MNKTSEQKRQYASILFRKSVKQNIYFTLQLLLLHQILSQFTFCLHVLNVILVFVVPDIQVRENERHVSIDKAIFGRIVRI